MRRANRMPRGVVGALVVGLALLGAAAAATVGTTDPPLGKPGRYANSVSDKGEHRAPDRAAEQALAGFASPDVTDVSYEAAKGNPGTLHVTESARREPIDGDLIALTWNAAMIQGATAELMRSDETTLADVLGDATITLSLPNAEQVQLDPASMGSIAGGQQFGAAGDPVSDKELTANAKVVLARFGLTASRIEIRHPLDAALVIRASIADDAAVDWTIDGLRSALEGRGHRYEGLLITLTAPDGSPRLVGGVAYRTGLGGIWFADGQDARFGALHGGSVAPGVGRPHVSSSSEVASDTLARFRWPRRCPRSWATRALRSRSVCTRTSVPATTARGASSTAAPTQGVRTEEVVG